MNIFLPYEFNIISSVISLDDKRLNKSIIETYQLLSNAIKEQNGEKIKGYKNHPIYVHYKENIGFLAVYGQQCCREYHIRFGKCHKLNQPFWEVCYSTDSLNYVPFYMEGSKGQPNYIRTTENVSELYQQKLCKKWDSDKANGRPPKWTNREIPSFYINFLEKQKCQY
jgi:hypothetical protein